MSYRYAFMEDRGQCPRCRITWKVITTKESDDGWWATEAFTYDKEAHDWSSLHIAYSLTRTGARFERWLARRIFRATCAECHA